MENTAHTNVVSNDYQSHFNEYISQESEAVRLQNCVGRLLYEKGIELVLFRNHLTDISISDILQLHNYANEVVKKPISVMDTASLAVLLLDMNLAPSKLDIGKLAYEWQTEKSKFESQAAFLAEKLTDFGMDAKEAMKPKDVVLFGFGRIGRLAASELIKQAGKGQQLRLRAIVLRKVDAAQLKKRAYLLRNDSVHGPIQGSVIEDYENLDLIVNGQRVKFIAANNPEDIDYTAHGISDALLIDNTGVFKDRAALSRHLSSKGISKVFLTAPGKEIPNVVYGVNNKELDIENETIYSLLLVLQMLLFQF